MDNIIDIKGYSDVIKLSRVTALAIMLSRNHDLTKLLVLKCHEKVLHNGVKPWPTIFTRPNITHFEEKNSRPDF